MSEIATGLRSDDTALERLLELFGPAGAADASGTTGGPQDEWIVLPSRSKPRYLLPFKPNKVAAAVRFRASAKPVTRAATKGLNLLLGTGLGGALRPNRVGVPSGTAADPSLLTWLRERLDEPTLGAAVAIGAPRANRKPVLQLIDGTGRTLGYGKVAIDAHTRGLVVHEAGFLATARNDHPRLILPELLLHDQWKGHDLLVVKDLGDGLEDSSDLVLTPEVVEAIASLGERSEARVLDSPWWHGNGERVGKLTGPDRRVLERCHQKVGLALAGHEWSFGAWHGDLAPWNACWRDGVLNVWDWERAGGPVPVGFDAVHSQFQVALLRRQRPPVEAAAAPAEDGTRVLAGLGYDRKGADALVAAYLLELRTRLAEDARRGSLGRVAWVADAVEAAIMGGPS